MTLKECANLVYGNVQAETSRHKTQEDGPE
jgi:hypothetical protein